MNFWPWAWEAPREASSVMRFPSGCSEGTRCWVSGRNVHGQRHGIAVDRHAAGDHEFGCGKMVAHRRILRRLHHLLDLFGRRRAVAPYRGLWFRSGLYRLERRGLHRLRGTGHVDSRLKKPVLGATAGRNGSDPVLRFRPQAGCNSGRHPGRSPGRAATSPSRGPFKKRLLGMGAQNRVRAQ